MLGAAVSVVVVAIATVAVVLVRDGIFHNAAWLSHASQSPPSHSATSHKVARHPAAPESDAARLLATATHRASTATTETATLTTTIAGPSGGTLTASIQEVRKPLRVSMNMTLTPTSTGQEIGFSAIVTTKSLYMNFGNFPSLPRALRDKWMAFPLSALPGGNLTSLMQSMQSENPVSQTEILAGASDVHADGTKIVGGVKTTLYTGYYTKEDVLRALTPAQQALNPALQYLSGDAHFKIWIDRQGRVRKLVETQTIQSNLERTVIVFNSFNQPVTITIPRGSRVLHIPASELNRTSL